MKNTGNILLSTLFVILLSVAGLGLMTHSLNHKKIITTRRDKIFTCNNLYQELIYHIHHYRETIFSINWDFVKTPDLNYFNEDNFPISETAAGRIKNCFNHLVLPLNQLNLTRITNNISLKARNEPYLLQARVEADLLSGNIPLTLFPAFINKDPKTDPEQFFKKNKIKNHSAKLPLVSDRQCSMDISNFLVYSLNINGENLSWSQIREKFGLEVCNEPIPDGIYINQSEDHIETIFIQGDADSIKLEADGNIQMVIITYKGSPYEIRYIPNEMYFKSWKSDFIQDMEFSQKILVNGNIWMLEQGGKGAFAPETDLVIFSSQKIVITSDLQNQNPDTRRINLNQLTVTTNSSNFFNAGDKDSGVTINPGITKEIELSIITDGILANQTEDLELTGSIYCSELNNSGTINLHFKQSGSVLDQFFYLDNFTYLNNFFISSIEEAPVE